MIWEHENCKETYRIQIHGVKHFKLNEVCLMIDPLNTSSFELLNEVGLGIGIPNSENFSLHPIGFYYF